MVRLFSWSMLGTVSCYSLNLCLCLYQLTLSAESLSSVRMSKFVFQFLAIFLGYYSLCHSSNTLDECQTALSRSLYTSFWYQCTVGTKRDLLYFLARLQHPNHLKFSRGSLVLSKELFVRAIRFAYSFVNCIRMSHKHK
uniref:Uncharacterized protein n=1 Tax=Cacopsylla melanoneura TaxID=428564 RepID=A0A8D9BQS3_9HEMI